ncbi:IS30 family transposase [Arthrobacter sp. 18067]|uniref:IS30 family transposase n=1 Tax=Arthrobacter sp. 18067 TaxID=2681413 RepID=UPI00135814AB|nr:IS30 family transposase [Arthrobacter sp. 18067]
MVKFTNRLVAEVVQSFWQQVADGARYEDAGASVGWSITTVRRELRSSGGVRPRRGRTLTGRSLSFEERELISLWRSKESVREIARRLGQAPSTISRELRRNADKVFFYRATTAHARAHARAARPKTAKLNSNKPLRKEVEKRLDKKDSPAQIAGRLRKDFPNNPEMWVSHETIYQSLYLESRGGLKRELVKNLRTGRTLRKPQHRPDERRGRIQDKVMIADRPAEVEDRAVPGHWEGDLIVGKDGKTAIGTIVERTTGFVMLLHVPTGENRAESVRDGLIRKMGALPDELRLSLTWDQGTEMRRHKEVKIAADIDIYFCDPHAPWQRGSNENTNGLLRQYFPKGTDLSIYSQTDLDYVAHELNDRPRQRFDFCTPNEMIRTFLLR